MAVEQDVMVRAVARVNLAAIERNAARMLRELVAGAASGATPSLCAVVKADGYGHGAQAAAATEGVTLAGAMTHFATADDRGDAFFAQQLERFEDWALPLQAAHPAIVLHAANSAATLRDRAAHFDMVRAGVSIYG